MTKSDTSINGSNTDKIEYPSKSTEPPGEITTPGGKDGTGG